jgi:hypothetical protein
MDNHDDQQPFHRLRQWRNKQPCADCKDKLVAHGVLVCRPCYLTKHKAKPVPINLCPDCSKPINIRANHCRRCYTRHRLRRYHPHRIDDS